MTQDDISKLAPEVKCLRHSPETHFTSGWPSRGQACQQKCGEVEPIRFMATRTVLGDVLWVRAAVAVRSVMEGSPVSRRLPDPPAGLMVTMTKDSSHFNVTYSHCRCAEG